MGGNRLTSKMIWIGCGTLIIVVCLFIGWQILKQDDSAGWQQYNTQMEQILDDKQITSIQPKSSQTTPSTLPVSTPDNQAEETEDTNKNDKVESIPKSNPSIMININSATEQELEKLPTIGPAKAKAIVNFRTQQGIFQRQEDIMKVKGIGSKTYEKMKDMIKVSD